MCHQQLILLSAGRDGTYRSEAGASSPGDRLSVPAASRCKLCHQLVWFGFDAQDKWRDFCEASITCLNRLAKKMFIPAPRGTITLRCLNGNVPLDVCWSLLAIFVSFCLDCSYPWDCAVCLNKLFQPLGWALIYHITPSAFSITVGDSGKLLWRPYTSTVLLLPSFFTS